MMTTLKTSLLLVATGILLYPSAQASNANKDLKADHNVRIMRNEDGSYTKFSKSADGRVIWRRNYKESSNGNGERVLRMSIIYRKDVHGKLRSGRIHDGTGKILYRVVYGYHKETGQLVAENMYDARVKRTKIVTDPKTGKTKEVEIPVRRLYHRYDAQGRPAKPIVFCMPAGKRAEELFGKDGSSYLRKDPWEKK
jgi:hypothetical protein